MKQKRAEKEKVVKRIKIFLKVCNGSTVIECCGMLSVSALWYFSNIFSVDRLVNL